MAEPEVRQRKPEKGTETETTSPPEKQVKKAKSKKDGKVEYENPWLDVARVLTFLFVVSCGLSYLVSAGESFFWTMKVPPKYLRTEWWKSQLVRESTGLSSYGILDNLETDIRLPIVTDWPYLPVPRATPRL